MNASGYARDHFGSGWNSLQDAYDKFNNGFMGNWARTPNGGETLLPGGGLLNFDPGTGIISSPFSELYVPQSIRNAREQAAIGSAMQQQTINQAFANASPMNRFAAAYQSHGA